MSGLRDSFPTVPRPITNGTGTFYQATLSSPAGRAPPSRARLAWVSGDAQLGGQRPQVRVVPVAGALHHRPDHLERHLLMRGEFRGDLPRLQQQLRRLPVLALQEARLGLVDAVDRKSTRLNSSHEWISYAVFCLKKK